MSEGALAGVRVLDFSALVPGPLATLMLAQAGAEIIKVERPPEGDTLRQRAADFAMLNAGKRSVFVDLKNEADKARLLPLIDAADVLIEQFRPGVMDRLGLGAATLRARNPRLIYCSINGYGSHGPNALKVGHDLTYAAESGLLMQSADRNGAPVMPATMIADIGGGTYPALMNILLALYARERTGQGAAIEIAMADGLAPFLQPAYASAFGRGHWPLPGDAIETGASPRYALYEAADGRWIAAAPVEPAFWRNFCLVIGLPELVDADPENDAQSKRTIAARLKERASAEWLALFEGKDTACSLVKTFEEAMAGRSHADEALPLPVAAALRAGPLCPASPVGRAGAIGDWGC